MTFILSLVNPDQVILISDRKLSAPVGNDPEVDFNKAGVLLTRTGRHIFGFSGLARYKRFDTRRWLIETLYDCCAPDYDVDKIVGRLRDRATAEFQSNPDLKELPAKSKRLSIIFSGYLYNVQPPPLQATGILTNFQQFKNNYDDPEGVDSQEAWDKFVMNYYFERRPLVNTCTSIQYIGMWRAMFLSDEPSLRNRLRERSSLRDIVHNGVSQLRKMANRKEASDFIGSNLSVLVISRDSISHVLSRKFDENGAITTFKPDYVVGISKSFHCIKSDYVQEKGLMSDWNPLVFPPDSDELACLCGAGKKYKNCHGKF